MQYRMTERFAATPREWLLWAVVGALVLGQLVVFYLLCDGQVHKAQVRDANLQVRRVAIVDCMQYTPKASLASCAYSVAPVQGEAMAQNAYLADVSDRPAAIVSR